MYCLGNNVTHTTTISFHFKPFFIQVYPIEIIDLVFKGDLQLQLCFHTGQEANEAIPEKDNECTAMVIIQLGMTTHISLEVKRFIFSNVLYGLNTPKEDVSISHKHQSTGTRLKHLSVSISLNKTFSFKCFKHCLRKNTDLMSYFCGILLFWFSYIAIVSHTVLFYKGQISCYIFCKCIFLPAFNFLKVDTTPWITPWQQWPDFFLRILNL